jgi:hypothetical protein
MSASHPPFDPLLPPQPKPKRRNTWLLPVILSILPCIGAALVGGHFFSMLDARVPRHSPPIRVGEVQDDGWATFRFEQIQTEMELPNALQPAEWNHEFGDVVYFRGFTMHYAYSEWATIWITGLEYTTEEAARAQHGKHIAASELKNWYEGIVFKIEDRTINGIEGFYAEGAYTDHEGDRIELVVFFYQRGRIWNYVLVTYLPDDREHAHPEAERAINSLRWIDQVSSGSEIRMRSRPRHAPGKLPDNEREHRPKAA